MSEEVSVDNENDENEIRPEGDMRLEEMIREKIRKGTKGKD